VFGYKTFVVQAGLQGLTGFLVFAAKLWSPSNNNTRETHPGRHLIEAQTSGESCGQCPPSKRSRLNAVSGELNLLLKMPGQMRGIRLGV
jgi:hypothetical protein